MSTTTQKPNHCRPAALKLSHFRQPKKESNPIQPTMESCQVRSPTQNSSQFGPPTQTSSSFACLHKKKVIFAPRSKTTPISTTHTSNQFHPYTETMSNLISHTEIKSTWTTHTKKQVNNRALVKNKWFQANIQVTSQFLPSTQQPNLFRPYHESNQVRFPRLRWYQLWPPSQKPSQFPCKHKNN